MDYTEILRTELERVNMRGNADKETVRKLASIIFDMDQKLEYLNKKLEELAPTPVVEPEPVKEPEPELPKSTRRVGAKPEDK